MNATIWVVVGILMIAFGMQIDNIAAGGLVSGLGGFIFVWHILDIIPR